MNYLPTLSKCLEKAYDYAAKAGYTLAEDAFEHFIFGGVAYGETKRSSETLITRKGNEARKCLQVTVSRPALGEPNAGEYEVNLYIL